MTKPAPNGNQSPQDRRSASDRRNGQDDRRNGERRNTPQDDTHKRTYSKIERNELYKGVQTGYTTEARPIKVRGVEYPSVDEGRAARVFHRDGILFTPHWEFANCPDRDNPQRLRRYELDFRFHKPVKLEGIGGVVDGVEYKGRLTEADFLRNDSIKFKYQLRIHQISRRHLGLWEQDGTTWTPRTQCIAPTPIDDAALEWLEKLEYLLNKNNILYKRGECFERVVDPWATEKTGQARFFPFIADLGLVHPIKVRGITQYVDGFIVRSRLMRDNLEAIDALRLPPYRKEIYDVGSDLISTWMTEGLLPNRKPRNDSQSHYHRKRTQR